MTPTETVMLARYVKALCPQQAIDEYTADAWHDVLGHLSFAECREAAIAVSRRQPFIAPAEIIREIADKRAASQPHSEACRIRNCRDCRMGWCSCTCHPRAVAALTAPQQFREPGEPVALGDALKAITRRPE